MAGIMDVDDEVRLAMRDLEQELGHDGGPGRAPTPAERIVQEVARATPPPLLEPILDPPEVVPPVEIPPPNLDPNPPVQIVRVPNSALNTPFRQMVPVRDPRLGEIRPVAPRNIRRRQGRFSARNHQWRRNEQFRLDRSLYFAFGDAFFQLAQNQQQLRARGQRPRRSSQPKPNLPQQ